MTGSCQLPIMDVAVVYGDHNRDILERDLMPSVAGLHEPVRLIALNRNAKGNRFGKRIAAFFNFILTLDGPDLVLFAHPDVNFGPDFTPRIRETVQSFVQAGTPWGAMGIVGRTWKGDYRWGRDSEKAEEVCTLDCCAVVLSRSSRLRFDTLLFNEFHCYVEDICMQAHAAGRKVCVIPAQADHNSATMRAIGAQWGRYRLYRRILQLKWYTRFPSIMTP